MKLLKVSMVFLHSFFFPSTVWYQLPEHRVGGKLAAAEAGKNMLKQKLRFEPSPKEGLPEAKSKSGKSPACNQNVLVEKLEPSTDQLGQIKLPNTTL